MIQGGALYNEIQHETTDSGTCQHNWSTWSNAPLERSRLEMHRTKTCQLNDLLASYPVARARRFPRATSRCQAPTR
eukprot:2049295-Pyramimonas_sp.AAC.1